MLDRIRSAYNPSRQRSHLRSSPHRAHLRYLRGGHELERLQAALASSETERDRDQVFEALFDLVEAAGPSQDLEDEVGRLATEFLGELIRVAAQSDAAWLTAVAWSELAIRVPLAGPWPGHTWDDLPPRLMEALGEAAVSIIDCWGAETVANLRLALPAQTNERAAVVLWVARASVAEWSAIHPAIFELAREWAARPMPNGAPPLAATNEAQSLLANVRAR